MTEETYDKNRIVNFSDAVFSIVMTLLILEVAVPASRELGTKDFSVILSNRIPDFIGLLVSFLVSALYWIGHLRLMRYVTEVSSKLLWLNIYFLLAIVILPFSTAMYVNGFTYAGPFIFYCVNLGVIGLFSLLMLRYVYRTENKKTGFTTLYYKWYRARGLNVIVVWFVASLLAISFLWASRMIFLLLFVNQIFIDRYYKKRL